jgi:hypothetical protein
MIGTPEHIVLYLSKRKVILRLLGCVAFVVLGIVFARYRERLRIDPLGIVLCSYVGVPIFGLGVAAHLYLLVIGRPVVVVNDEGIFCVAPRWSAWFLHWDEILLIHAYEVAGQPMLGVWPLDLQGLLARKGWLGRRSIRVSLRFGWAPLNIAGSMLPIKVTELRDEIERRFGTELRPGVYAAERGIV